MSLVQIRIKDPVFSRMLKIVLLENRIPSEITNEKDALVPESCELIITDLSCAGKDVHRFPKTFFVLKRGEEPPEGKPFYVRPFLTDSLVSDVTAALFSGEKTAVETAPELSVDKKRFTAKYGKLSVSLPETEMRLLSLLHENRGKTVTNAEINEKVFGGKTAEGSNACAVYVNYLRKKLDEKIGKRLIFSVRGVGYVLKI